ncbi:MAG: DUF1273 family protein [Ruminococcaceae bacterium]|nr:DUF1273 family protein [Oscillospiraceae bacterium]
MKENVCCFFGHREIPEANELKKKLRGVIENLIVCEKIDTFLFGSKSQFDALCLETVTELKQKYPHIKRIYVRAEYPYINDSYKSYLLKSYEDTYYPQNIIGAGRAVYVKRNHEMINRSRFCVVYYSEKYSPKNGRSGTKIALDYAVKQNKRVINIA